MANDVRKRDLSDKLLEMGQSLIKEGTDMNDYTITQSGNILIVISAAILSDEDMFMFSQLCGMFTAKQVLDNMNGTDSSAGVKKYIQKIKKRRPKDGNTPTDNE